MKKQSVYFTSQAGKALKGSERIICRVEDGRVYVCNGYFLMSMAPFEYAEMVQPVTLCDAGNWIIDRGEKRELKEGEHPLPKMLHDSAAPVVASTSPTLCEKCPISFPSVRKAVVLGYYNPESRFAAFYNRDYVAAFDPVCTLHAVSHTGAAVMMGGQELVGVIMPIRVSDAARRACLAWYAEQEDGGEQPDARAAEIERGEMVQKIAEQAAALTAAEQRYSDLQHTAFEVECERNDLRRELDALKAGQPAAAEQPAGEQDARSAAEIIAARFAALDGVTAVIRGAHTAAPVVWLEGVTEVNADAVQAAGAKWSSKRGAYYVRVA